MKNYLSLMIIFSVTAVASFLNQMVYAYYFGAGSEFDLLNGVMSLPLSVIGIGGGALSLVLMPLLNEYQEKHGEVASFFTYLIRKYSKRILVMSLLVAMLQYIILYSKVTSSQKNTLLYLSILVGLFLFLSFINFFYIVYFNLQKKYVLASISALVVYIVSIPMCYFFAKNEGINIVIYSFLLANILLFLFFFWTFNTQYRGLLKVQKHIEFDYQLDLRKVLSGIVVILPFTIPVFIDAYFLLDLHEGSLSYASYANKIIVMVSSIMIQPLNLILFPKILTLISRKEFKKIYRLLTTLYIITLICISIAFVLSDLFFIKFMDIFFVRGEFTEKDAVYVFQIFKFYLVGAFGMVVMNIQTKVMTALKLHNILIFSGLLFIALYYFLLYLFIGDFGYITVGIAYSATWLMWFVVTSASIYWFKNRHLISNVK